jgi:hypothetical protein
VLFCGFAGEEDITARLGMAVMTAWNKAIVVLLWNGENCQE